MPRIELVKTNLVHKGFDTYVQIKVHKDIEEYFKKASMAKNPETKELEPVIEESGSWIGENEVGLSYYKKVKQLSNLVPNVQIIDNFGSCVITDDGRLNVAFLRIVGISGDNGVLIKANEMISGEALRRFLRDLRNWIKGFYESELMLQEVEGSVVVDVD